MYSTQNVKLVRHQGGGVALIVAFMMLVILGFTGLAIDGGRSYGVKAQLSAAADAGAIAGAMALSEGSNRAQRIANAKTAAARYYNLNYPNNFQKSTHHAPTTTVVRNANNQWQVTVTARATTPNLFMNALGFGDNDIRTIAQTIRQDLDLMLVLDSSGSMSGQIDELQDAAKNGFVSKFISGPGGDRLGVVSFAAGSTIAEPINRTGARGFDTASVNSAIDSLVAGGWTATSDAMRKALDELRAIPVAHRSSTQVMLVFSDGAPNMLAAEQGANRFNISRTLRSYDPDQLNQQISGDTSGMVNVPMYAVGNIPTAGRLSPTVGPLDQCTVTRATRNLTENIAKIARRDGVVIYTIGLGNQLDDIEYPSAGVTCGMNNDDRGSALLRRLANVPNDATNQNPYYVSNEPSGLYCQAAVASELQSCFEQIARDILRLTM